ncbi:MAG TPA: patatin-like phospholipase family protein [Ilumatobacter sp.]|nr:patatin-like phospholipase family protein [Ilumatobacter sp.]
MPVGAPGPLEWQTNGVQLTLHDRDGRRPIAWEQIGDLVASDFAIVLGAGGATGLSFEAGCLLALATDHRLRLGCATAMVGTSAGAIAASLIALGFEAADLAALVTEVHQHVDPSLTSLNVRFADDIPSVPGPLQLFRRPTFGSAVRGVGLVFRRRFTAALVNALKQGQFDLAPQLQFLDAVDWPRPDDRLRVCATHATTGRRHVFSASSDVPLMDAVAASCAVPGVMRPVTIDGTAYLDGGLVSPTNADVLHDFDGGPIIVVSPMSGRRSNTVIGRMSIVHARKRLAPELERLRRRHPVLVIEPGNALSAMVVDAALDAEHKGDIMTAAYLGSSVHP